MPLKSSLETTVLPRATGFDGYLVTTASETDGDENQSPSRNLARGGEERPNAFLAVGIRVPMAAPWASSFREIPATLRDKPALLERVHWLIQHEPIPGKVTEGGDRSSALRTILANLADGKLTLQQSLSEVGQRLPRQSSLYAANNKVFPDGWEERLVRTQFSRFYNQAVLMHLHEQGQTECYVPHSPDEAADSPCSLGLAGKRNSVNLLLQRLENSYGKGQWSNELKIPNHPHCTHVAQPIP